VGPGSHPQGSGGAGVYESRATSPRTSWSEPLVLRTIAVKQNLPFAAGVHNVKAPPGPTAHRPPAGARRMKAEFHFLDRIQR